MTPENSIQINRSAPPFAAISWMGGAIAGLSTMAVAGRVVSAELDTFELMLYRSAVSFAVMCACLIAMRDLSAARTNRIGLHAVRNISHFAGQNLWFFALFAAPMAQVIALEFTTPIWTMALAALFLREQPHRNAIIAAVLGFLGVLVITNPFTGSLSPGLIAAALCALGFAGAAVATRALTKTERVVTILFWLSATQLLFGFISAGWDFDIAWPSMRLWPWLILIGLAGLAAHLSLTQALRLATPASIMPIDFLRLPLLAVVGWLLYNEGLSQNVLLGSPLILIGVWLLLRVRTH